MTSNLNKKQTAAILAIVVVTVLLGALILVFPVSASRDNDASETSATQESHGNKPPTATAQTSGTPAAGNDDTVNMTDTQLQAAGIRIQTAGAARIQNSITLPGEIRFNADRTAHVTPRLAGVVERVTADLGQQVKKGQVLAVVASMGLSDLRSELLNAQKRLSLATTTYEREKTLWQDKISAEQDYLQAQQAMREAQIAVQNAQQKLTALGAAPNGSGALNRYEIRAPFDGMLIEKHITLGDAVREDANIFTISDLSTVWAEISVPASELNRVRVGDRVTVKSTAFASEAAGTVSYVGALLGDQTRTATARVTLTNPNMTWRPGLFINVEIVANETEVPVAVAADAIQEVNNAPVVFARTANGFVARPVTVGRSDGKVTEIRKGVQAGMPYAADGSFVVKAELGKRSAKEEE